jgi:hypothetical protein
MSDPRLKGQEISVRVVNAGTVVSEIDSVGSFDDNVDLKEMEDGFLGEQVNRFDNALNGYGGNFEMQLTQANWILLKQAVVRKAQRVDSAVTFNIVVTDLYPNGDSAITTYVDVTFGPIPKTVASRTDFAKVKWSFKCSQLGEQINALP